MPRQSIQAQRNNLIRGSYPHPIIELTPRQTTLFNLILDSTPRENWQLTSVNNLACDGAVIQAMIETANKQIARDGLMITSPQGSKSHPLLSSIGSLSSKLSSILVKLKALPQNDQRVMANKVRAENAANAPLIVSTEDSPVTDWCEELERLTSHE